MFENKFFSYISGTEINLKSTQWIIQLFNSYCIVKRELNNHIQSFVGKKSYWILVRAQNVFLSEAFRTSITEERKICLVFKEPFSGRACWGQDLLKCHTSLQIPNEKLQSNADVP